MRILYVTEKVPFIPGSNDQARAYRQIEGLIEEGIHVDCIFFHDDFIYFLPGKDILSKSFNKKTIKAFKRSKRQLYTILDIVKGYPVTVSKYAAPELNTVIRTILKTEPYDTIHLQSKLAHNLKETEGLPKLLIDFVEADSWSLHEQIDQTDNKIAKYILMEEHRRLKRHDRDVRLKFDKGIVQSRRDREEISATGDQVKVVPHIQLVPKTLRRASRKKAIVFSGKMNAAHNIAAAKRLVNNIYLPLKQEIADLECWIVGGQPGAEVEELAKIDGVTVTGYVKDNISYIRNGSVYVAPLEFGTGIHQQIIEAAIQARPVVLSDTANSGIGFTDSKEAKVCGTDEEFIDSIRQLLEDSSTGTRLSRNAKKYVKRKFNKELAIRLLMSTYHSLLSNQQAADSLEAEAAVAEEETEEDSRLEDQHEGEVDVFIKKERHQLTS
ncbi:Glycosyl transferases group 1 [Evansella caseinilytica]|uniref:Glycosyl transferases group 1 n=1 Tax=Evansella caseinilytica TaxID=1503961 RepID=A0A1H3IYF7_9BACI|nr:glycosyltransferase [Evansella caseinilytica]SDY32741.1 Glycosyl transferases group 1 [Evansella caseinilytica]